MTALRPAVFYFPDSDSGDRWEGWWHGVRWNGWAVPYFDRATMIEILLTMGRVERREEPGDDGGLAVLSEDEQTLLEFWPMHVEGVEVNVYMATGLCLDVDPEECANCGGSTAPGTPDPHECMVRVTLCRTCMVDLDPMETLHAEPADGGCERCDGSPARLAPGSVVAEVPAALWNGGRP